MLKFPEDHKRKKTPVPMAVWCPETESQIDVIFDIVGVERVPLIVHRKLNIDPRNPRDFRVQKGDKWTVTHLFSGYNIGIYGSYKYCSTIANRLLEEPLLYLPSLQMMSNHPDFASVHQLICELKQAFWHLGGTKMPADPRG